MLLNGKEMNHVTYADTRAGKIRVHDWPLKLHKHRKRFIERTLYGRVLVEPLR